MREATVKDYGDIFTLAFMHAGKEYVKEIRHLKDNPYVKCWVEYDNRGIRAFLIYLTAPQLSKDIVYVTDRENTYTLNTYRLMKKIHKLSSKTILSSITSNYDMMQKFALRNNGILVDNILIFTKE